MSPPHKDKAKGGGTGATAGWNDDMAKDASFYVFSFLFPRNFTLQKTSDNLKKLKKSDIVWQEALASGSLLKVPAGVNRTYYHAVHEQKGAEERFSLIFRVIDTFIPVDPETAAEVNHTGYRFESKAQVNAGRARPTKEELKKLAESQHSFTTSPQRKEMKEKGADMVELVKGRRSEYF
jgi:hypothetical protein